MKEQIETTSYNKRTSHIFSRAEGTGNICPSVKDRRESSYTHVGTQETFNGHRVLNNSDMQHL